MIGLMWKDLLCLRKSLATYVIVIVFYALTTLAGLWDINAMAAVLAILVSVLPYSCFSYDHAAKWDRYGLALPVSRAQTVLARYLVVVMLLVLAMVLVGLIGAAAALFGDGVDWTTYGFTAAVVLAMGIFLNAVLLPLIYRFGAERARILFFVVLGGAVAVGISLVNIADRLFDIDGLLAAMPPVWLPVAVVLAAGAALLAASYFVSLHIYSSREW